MSGSEYHFNKRTDRTYFSRQITTDQGGLRYMSKVIEGQEGLREVTEKKQIVLRSTPQNRYEIKATLYEDDRFLRTLTIQKFNQKSGPSDFYFTFVGPEIQAVRDFLDHALVAPIKGSGSFHVTDTEMAEAVEAAQQARAFLANHHSILSELISDENLKSDLIAVGYRRAQLRVFERLLTDEAYFAEERDQCAGPEDVWQKFFERNKWIFGYGLSYVSLNTLDNRKLEQITSGSDVWGPGKRVDGLMKTQAAINSTCFVEIKHHLTQLTAKQYRSDVWLPSEDLAGGVAQVQTTVQNVIDRVGRKAQIFDGQGNPTGETLFNIIPRSFLVIGSLEQFNTEHGINESRFRAFELFRRHTLKPEIITFDELFNRAKFIVEQSA